MNDQTIENSNQDWNNIEKNRNRKIFTNKIKEMFIYIGIVIIVFIIFSVVIIFMKNGTNKPKSESEQVIKYMTNLGKDFYETYYYPQLSKLKENNMIEGSIEEYLYNFEKTGISVSLNKVIELQFKTEEAIDKELKKFDCDYDKTKFLIYPQSPYEKKSHKITPYIVCNNLKVEEK